MHVRVRRPHRGGDRRRVVRVAAAMVAAVVLAEVAIIGLLPQSASADKVATIRLSAGQTYAYTSKRPTSGSGAGVSLIGSPTQCQSAPYSATCDVFFLTVDRDESEDALNFLVGRLAWNGQGTVPPLALAVVGLTFGSIVDYNLYIWEKDGTGAWTRRADLTGGLSNPELIGWVADKGEYAITIQNSQGASLGYDFSLALSNEKFQAPFEALDPSGGGGAGAGAPVDLSGDETPVAPTPSASSAFEDIALPAATTADIVAAAPAIEADSDFTGFRSAVDESLTGNLAALRGALQTGPVISRAPSWALVIFWLLVVPLLLAALLAWYIRRRRPTALSS